MPEILIFGAGNIGRAFIGQVFSANGWTVVFADINKKIINLLNERKSYPVVIRREGVDETVVTVDQVSAISVKDKAAVRKKLVKADIIATSVGKNALPHIAPVLAEGLLMRFAAGTPPVDLILAENIHDGRAFLEGNLANPEELFIEGVLADKKTNGLVRAAMKESASALILMYPDVFTKQDLQRHIEDLLYRFKNKALGDTVFRVGRDLPYPHYLTHSNIQLTIL